MNEYRRIRIDRIKRVLPKVIMAAIIVPTLLCVILGIALVKTRTELRQAGAQISELEKKLSDDTAPGSGLMTITTVDGGSGEETGPEQAKSRFDVENLMKEDASGDTDKPYCIYLTFDDGPSENTDKILMVLREYDVKASFFMNGRTDENSLMLYEQVVRAGHTLGMHSYSHKYSQVYRSREAFEEDLDEIRTLISDTTGVSPVYYRFPGGSSTNATSKKSMRDFIDILHENGIEYIDWNIDSGDGAGDDADKEEIIENIFKNFGRYHENVVLLHDGPGHDATVEALPEIIERARNMGALLLPITDDTVPVHHLDGES